ncbi:hypothetical protein [Paenibacillus abyssi]|uniref:Uncharacterized protein n=1 Tax=Paenibacillus abyssi TaxID=1340531 RepID=A0A917D2B3_9BACL|nr:hypothetical protein [Paenibacillus abyssi]GGG06792.1 hypothetical protein GCM10010916_24640 [Paenibacillus abyssi]
MMKVITFKNKSIPVYFPAEKGQYYDLLNTKLDEMSLDFEFRKRWKMVKSVEVVRDVAIFQYNDGTKLYLEVS